MPPYLPPRLFHEYVVEYARPVVQAIQSTGGFARLHCHGRLHLILEEIISLGVNGLDPLEPPPQGDLSLREARQRCGDQMVLFGNIEVSEIETLPPADFERRVRQAIVEGSGDNGAGFVLMPTACPIGRVLSEQALCNYTTMVKVIEEIT
jgi:uroporphyrinogen-III decarboxylase